MNINTLISEAKLLLRKNPRDNIHGIDHHHRVFENTQTISKSLDTAIDKDVLKVSAYWHDLMVYPESINLGSKGLLKQTLDYLKNLMEKNNYPKDFQKNVYKAIKQHNFFTSRQSSIEGKILFDADKLDVLHEKRYRKIVENIKSKKLSQFQIKAYTKASKIWLSNMRSRYHFEVSRQIHDQRVKSLLKDKSVVKFAKQHGVDIKKLVGKTKQ